MKKKLGIFHINKFKGNNDVFGNSGSFFFKIHTKFKHPTWLCSKGRSLSWLGNKVWMCTAALVASLNMRSSKGKVIFRILFLCAIVLCVCLCQVYAFLNTLNM